ncbi:annexin-2 receptor-like [Sus scrofa]|uniref:annexin-2 receptor-like n=1 Tax=Sus scrofa TaxID=9823 RepID=UPI000A2B4E5D|nr:annexin-2 receptor-like [Sus scrofa]XP_020932760.1 annexin-2 receptor-like [Sus scrofa]
MEQTVPRCVREPWDSAEDSQEPEALQILSSGDPGGWRLPLYPSLGQLSWDDQDVSRELLSTPCGLLRPFCPKHGPRAQSACRPSAEPLAPHTPTTPGTRRQPQAPRGEAAAARPQRFPGRVFWRPGPSSWKPRPLTAGTRPEEHRPPLGLGRHHPTSQRWWRRISLKWLANPLGCLAHCL